MTRVGAHSICLRTARIEPYDRPVETLCRDCGHRPLGSAGTCPACGSARLLSHAELHDLAIAHLDCDAFYAASRSATARSSASAR